MTESPTSVTFREPSYALFDVHENAVRTTEHGNLAIFSTQGMAEAWARGSAHNLIIIPVNIKPVQS